MKPPFLLILCFFAIALKTHAQKINGVNFVAERTAIEQNGFDDLKTLNATWVSWIPYAFCEVKNGKLTHGLSWQWDGETTSGTAKAIRLARNQGLKVMVKPHVWLSDHSFTGTMELTAEGWKEWQKGYSKYILDFAQLAQENNAEMFCIGTEQFAAITHDGNYWKTLIAQVRKVYKGQITYAANWDTYDNVPFWNHLDHIGIDAYFPLSEKSRPTVAEIENGWKELQSDFESLSYKHNKPILFTEYGYRCTEYACKNPWVAVTKDEYCEPCQDHALQAMFNTFWGKKWFSGGFLWKWFEPSKSVRHENEKSFFVKGKQAEKTISRSFGLYRN